MTQPWIGVQKPAAVPTPNAQLDPPFIAVDDFANMVVAAFYDSDLSAVFAAN